MTRVICKSDCEFCQNEERVCSLDTIQLSQDTPYSPTLYCQQYVRSSDIGTRHKETDIDRARAAGTWDALKTRLAGNR